jgi:hypothetical protein
LTQIYLGNIDSLHGGDKLILKKWIFQNKNILTVEKVIRHLLDERINFQVKHNTGEYTCQTSVGLIDAFIHLNFQPSDSDNYAKPDQTEIILINPNKHTLCSISIISEEDMKAAYKG